MFLHVFFEENIYQLIQLTYAPVQHDTPFVSPPVQKAYLLDDQSETFVEVDVDSNSKLSIQAKKINLACKYEDVEVIDPTMVVSYAQFKQKLGRNGKISELL